MAVFLATVGCTVSEDGCVSGTVGCTVSDDGCCADSDGAAVSLFTVLFSIAAALDDGTVSCCTLDSSCWELTVSAEMPLPLPDLVTGLLVLPGCLLPLL